MTALVNYASSDGEDDDNDIQPEKPAKIAKLGEDQGPLQSANATVNTRHATQAAPRVDEPVIPASEMVPSINPILGPSQGPSVPSQSPLPSALTSSTPSSPPQSPYTATRLQTRSLTLPPAPNFDIPPSPSPPHPGTPAHAALSATTKKFTRFLELKTQGVHLNARLLDSVALRNPGVGSQLRGFARITTGESYASAIALGFGSEGVDEGGWRGGVPVTWPEECYVEALVEGNKRREKLRLAGRGGVEFVAAAAGAGAGVGRDRPREGSGSVSGSAAGTPAGGVAGGGGGGKKRGVGKR
ncbi:hypothetical protein B0A54_12423 [Friedmanniomyces endolithicus]|uniref:Uncharacterized protein n=1 Tax=Friedmanniomyces endolithicus TaxID=329885 RepID=A0A4V5N8H1_9PEZI|nr:hypothetical protein LTS09_003743 [Friedmanniomyces endolithicus]TKA36409.1 hypothetical protein B0A54_12423 [Friedmanniomyces endolithicus]